MANDFRFLEFRVDKYGVKRMTQEELAKKLNLTRSRIVALEQKPDVIPTREDLQAYCTYFNTTADYLLGIRDTKTVDENISMINKTTGLNENSIETIKKLKNTYEFEKTMKIFNYIMSDTFLFGMFLDSIKDYIEPGYTIPIHPELNKDNINIKYVENIDIESNSILANTERCIYIGKQHGEYNGEPLYDIKAIQVSQLSELNLIKIQEILQTWKNMYQNERK